MTDDRQTASSLDSPRTGVTNNVSRWWFVDQTSKKSGLANIDICSSNGISRKSKGAKLNETDWESGSKTMVSAPPCQSKYSLHTVRVGQKRDIPRPRGADV